MHKAGSDLVRNMTALYIQYVLLLPRIRRKRICFVLDSFAFFINFKTEKMAQTQLAVAVADRLFAS